MIKEAVFVLSGTKNEDYPQDFKNEYLFLGRSNVGKSSLINFLTKRKSLARISQTPGKTVTLNYYLINNSFYLVDAPGYGYAKRSKTDIKGFGKMIESYLTTRKQLKKVCLLVDYKIGPTKDDLLMYEFLKHFNLDIAVIATKVDKLNQREKNMAEKRFAHFFKDTKVFLSSTIKNKNVDDLYNVFKEEI